MLKLLTKPVPKNWPFQTNQKCDVTKQTGVFVRLRLPERGHQRGEGAVARRRDLRRRNRVGLQDRRERGGRVAADLEDHQEEGPSAAASARQQVGQKPWRPELLIFISY